MLYRLFCYCITLIVCGLSAPLQAQHFGPYIEIEHELLGAEHVGLIYNERDPLSFSIARYYQHRRQIPDANVVAVAFDPQQTVMSAEEFSRIKRQVDNALGSHVQVLTLTWAQPYQVACMGMTAAFTFGYDEEYCAYPCELTKPSPYYYSASRRPYTDFGFRPTMMLAATSLEQAIALIERGIRADSTMPSRDSKALLVATRDKNRNVRKVYFDDIYMRFDRWLDVVIKHGNKVKNYDDVLFYFTGATQIRHLDTINFLPGAMADHLTSYGGKLTDSKQMSVLEWLEHGATASYGTAVEPCNVLAKFPNPSVAMWHYFRGASLIEAYWKSVRMPGQGNFVGEPLAAPFRGYRLSVEGSKLIVTSPLLRPGRYRIFAANSLVDEEVLLERQTVNENKVRIEISRPIRARYRIEAIY